MHRLCTKLYFDLNFIANISPYIWGNVRGTRGKIMCHTSAGFHAVILVEWISFDTRSKNLQNRRKFGGKIRIQNRPDTQDS